ncbi:hypothetical protein V495_00415 [Pseudogymnoascus sp. VKM F-4514 (FW-929)]|nr:hypothetical protein V490_00673 [Pseudogymnoascus sp. VKM F-3557]KFY49929.1 hypothetical protein V495_00415 [Pseudogymnoascus sp. VKM F-4514 (FW-929)]KFY67843.1 hypothetical protein V497_00183 [Pseudogymnoascus sp. VKM F-4516 (FW-969)]
MRFINVITAALLPIAALTSPLATTSISEEEAVALKFSAITTRDDDAEAVGLLKRSKSCDVVNVVTEVDCWWLPKHNGKGNHYVRSFKGTTNNIPFDCWTKCEKVGGITTWFWTYSSTLGGCYVPGYYLDNNCVSSGSGALPQCSFAAADRAQGGCA